MAKADKEDLAEQAAKRAEFRLHHVGTKLNERELGALEGLLAQRGQSQGEFIRGLILAEIERDRQGVRASVELEEITAIRCCSSTCCVRWRPASRCRRRPSTATSRR